MMLEVICGEEHIYSYKEHIPCTTKVLSPVPSVLCPCTALLLWRVHSCGKRWGIVSPHGPGSIEWRLPYMVIACLHACVRSCVHAFMCACVRACLPACVRACVCVRGDSLWPVGETTVMDLSIYWSEAVSSLPDRKMRFAYNAATDTLPTYR